MSVPDDGRPGLLWGTNEIVLENIWDVIRKPFTSVRGGSARRLTLIYYIADGPWDVYKVTAMPPRLTLLRVKKCFPCLCHFLMAGWRCSPGGVRGLWNGLPGMLV